MAIPTCANIHNGRPAPSISIQRHSVWRTLSGLRQASNRSPKAKGPLRINGSIVSHGTTDSWWTPRLEFSIYWIDEATVEMVGFVGVSSRRVRGHNLEWAFRITVANIEGLTPTELSLSEGRSCPIS